MRPETVISVYAEEIDGRKNTRVLTNERDRMVYQVAGQHRTDFSFHVAIIMG